MNEECLINSFIQNSLKTMARLSEVIWYEACNLKWLCLESLLDQHIKNRVLLKKWLHKASSEMKTPLLLWRYSLKDEACEQSVQVLWSLTIISLLFHTQFLKYLVQTGNKTEADNFISKLPGQLTLFWDFIYVGAYSHTCLIITASKLFTFAFTWVNTEMWCNFPLTLAICYSY